MNKRLPFILMLSVCGMAAADDGSTPMMPDGSRDMYVGLALAGRSASAAGEQRPSALRLLFQARWSNGVFISASGVAGIDLADTAGVEYGPLLAMSNARTPGDSRRLRGTQAISGTTDAGGFFNLYLGNDMRLRTSVVYDTSAGGLRAEAGVQKSWSGLAPHHTLSLSAGVALADGAVMRERYEVRRDLGGARDYRPSAGVDGINAGVNWNWELSSKWLVSSALTATRLGAQPAASPVVERRTLLILSSGLAYRF
jgi:outer membrane scaffolding protein for murein synthesis (MipA/OmpV family)